MVYQDTKLATRLRNRRRQYTALQITSRALDFSQSVVTIGGVVLIILLQIPWLGGFFELIGISNSTAFTQTVVVVVLASLILQLRAVGQAVARVPRDNRHFADPMDVYPVLLERVRAVKRPEDMVLDVLGMTLYTAWPSVHFWLERPELNGWTVRLCAVALAEDRLSHLVPEEWFQESLINLNQVFEQSRSVVLRRRGIVLEAYGYDFMPALHGFRLGNGDIFYSILRWQPDGRIGRDSYSYEFVPCDDRSQSAEAIRAVFGSWFDRACRHPWPAVETMDTVHRL
ncbi:MAG TPA: hypothetical protein VF054_06785 [Micromonosporaceae bacterium]